MLKKLQSLVAANILLLTLHSFALSSPKLIVVISLDQFRYDYLVKFREHFGTQGFRYLMENGANFSNASYKHALNKTGPGHAVMLTGAYGNRNGIIANNWYDQSVQSDVNCVGDKNTSLVGANGTGRSPANLLVPTFGDELRLHTGFKSKVISIAQKDRSAILMGGKMPTGAFWMMDSAFVTSNYYMNELPSWLTSFNSSGVVNSYFGKVWNRELPDDAYSMTDADDVAYESTKNGYGRTFPHIVRGDDPSRITKAYYYALITSPYGMEILSELAKAAIEGEQMGQGETPDLLCLGYSTPDYVGHDFGPDSREVMEIVVQADRVLAELLTYLDQRIGLRNTVVVLTSDHGVMPIPEYVRSRFPKVSAGRVSSKAVISFCNTTLTNTFGPVPKGKSWIKRMVDSNIYLDLDVLREKKLGSDLVARALADSLMVFPEVAAAVSHRDLEYSSSGSPLVEKMKRGFHPKRSGDVVVFLKPYYVFDEGSDGAEHGSPYEYDAHVPLIIMGDGARSGTYFNEASPADIGPTLSALLGVELPAGREGRILIEALKSP